MLKILSIHTTLSKQGSFIYTNGNTYKGNISSQNGMPHGLGTLYFKNGAIWEGEFQNGFMVGLGKYTQNNKGTFIYIDYKLTNKFFTLQ